MECDLVEEEEGRVGGKTYKAGSKAHYERPECQRSLGLGLQRG